MLQSLITINPAPSSDRHFAELQLVAGSCVFLSDGWCSVQSKLGESYLGATCAAFPRTANLVDGILEQSLDLSCPEATRLTLSDPRPIGFPGNAFDEQTVPNSRLTSYGTLPEQGNLTSGEAGASAIRRLIIRILQNRNFPVSKRLVLVGHVCDRLQRGSSAGVPEAAATLVEGFETAIAMGLFNEHLRKLEPRPETQLSIALNLLNERMSSDFVAPKFRRLFDEFQQGLNWTPESTLPEIAGRYTECHANYYAPLIKQHEYMWEHYLVATAFRSLFPYGTREAAVRLGKVDKPFYAQYSLLVVQFALLKTLLIGVSGFHGSTFSPDHVAEVVQIGTKTLDHSLGVPSRVLERLTGWELTNPARLSVLIEN
jgi:lysine-N-methylase